MTAKTSNGSGDLDVNGYTYGTTGKPHRLTSVTIGGVSSTLSYDNNGNITTYNAASGNDTFLAFDGQNRVTKITVGSSAGTTTPSARDEFWYDPDGQRFLGRESWDEGGVQKQARTVYLGNFEETIPASGSAYNLVQRTDLTATVRHIRTRTTGGAFATRFEYVYRDHLGSVDVVTNSAGVKLENKLSFDPFGGRREDTWASDIVPSSMDTILAKEDERYYRGFTDHEMLNRTGFVHMNGRVYDPRIGRFVSPDPIVQVPTFSQSYNRYAYVLNSPMSFTDPSGFECEDYCVSVRIGPGVSSAASRAQADAWNQVGNGGGSGGPLGKLYRPPEVVDTSWSGVDSIGTVADAVGTAATYFNTYVLGVELGDYSDLITGVPMAAINSIPIGRAASGAGAVGRTVTDFVAGVRILSREKTVARGTVDLRATVEGIQSGRLAARDVFRNREGLLPSKPAGYYREYVHSTPGVSGVGPQRIVQGQGGELYYTPDHYQTFIPLN